MPDFTSFKDILKNEMREQGVTLQELSQSTEISERYLRALIESDTAHLPPAPYIRGYLRKIATVLDVDFSMLWKYYENDKEVRASGSADTLPQNRFAFRPHNKIALVLTGVVLIALAIFFPFFTDFFGKPSLEIFVPNQESSVLQTDRITISGKVGRAQDSVFINNTEISVQDDGVFTQEVSLVEGANSFEIRAKRFLGKEMRVVRNVFYRTQPFTQETPFPTSTPSPLISPDTSPQITPSQ